jgi:23S rRNA pseudouridine2605 synthase
MISSGISRGGSHFRTRWGMLQWRIRPTGTAPLPSSSPLGLCRRDFLNGSSSNGDGSGDDSSSLSSSSAPGIRLSKLISHYATNVAFSRRTAETLIRQGHVTLAGHVIDSPHYLVNPHDLEGTHSRVIKVQGKGLQINLQNLDDETNCGKKKKPIVYAVHKLAGELVAERDPHGRPSLIERLQRGGVGKVGKNQQFHLKPIGRLDMPTEGLILLTNDGEYAREMELPKNQIHRVYRARVHGELTTSKLERIRKGGVRSKEGIRYGPMKVSVERNNSRGTNTWVELTTSEGKNRMIRNLFSALGSKLVYIFVSIFVGAPYRTHLWLLSVFSSDSDTIDSSSIWRLHPPDDSTRNGNRGAVQTCHVAKGQGNLQTSCIDHTQTDRQRLWEGL